MKRFISLLSVAALVLTLAACGKNQQTGETVTEEPSLSETVTETENQSAETTEPGTVDEAQMKAMLAEKTTDSIISFVYDDFDRDGIFEAFAFTGLKRESTVKRPYSADYTGEFWFINYSGVKKVLEWGDYWKIDKVLDVKTRKYYVLEKYASTGAVSLIWYVNGPSVKEAEISGKVGEIAAESPKNITAFSVYYSDDGTDTGVGYIRTKYYFYEDNGIKEYGGVKISRKELLTYPGAEQLLKDIESSGMIIGTIYYRENGSVSVNYQSKSSSTPLQTNLRLSISDKTLSVDASDGSIARGSASVGFYKAALFPKIATYPKKFPALETTTATTTTKPTTTTTTKPVTTATTTTATTKPATTATTKPATTTTTKPVTTTTTTTTTAVTETETAESS